MEESIYLVGGYWYKFSNTEQTHDYILSQSTTEEVANNVCLGQELVFINDKLCVIYELYFGNRADDRIIESIELDLKLPKIQSNSIYNVKIIENGSHMLGGNKPINFEIPKCDSIVPFQYLGYINNNDPLFSWLPFTLHLIYPIYLDFSILYLDYSFPLNPIILNSDEIEKGFIEDSNYLNKDIDVIFEEFRFSFEEALQYVGQGNIGSCGIPNWHQGFWLPYCLKSGKKMKFVGQFKGGNKVKKSNIEPKDEWYQSNYSSLSFLGGDLYIFFEPTSKVACYFIQ